MAKGGAASKVVSKTQADLAEVVTAFVFDPLGFVYWAFPWGVEGTALQKFPDGPEDWQVDVLIELGDRLRAGADATQATREAVQIAVASGHGIGKSALVCWIILWFLCTRVNPSIIITANTKTQLTTKTWRELSKWHNVSIVKEWFDRTATRIAAKWAPDTWAAHAIPWTKERSEAFAGTHADHVLVIFDEASGIDDIIWEVTEGAMTTGECIWIAFGNPTQNTGRFRECFRRFRDSWVTMHVDSRSVRVSNKTILERWVRDYGEDSDFVRIRVRGIFPRSSANQLIGEDVVDEAMKRKPFGFKHAALIMGVDVARFGSDQSVIYFRQGTATRKVIKRREMDTMQLAGLCAECINAYKPDAVFVDVVGIGAGVVDRLRQLGYGQVVGVNNADKAIKETEYRNKRAETWCGMRDWLKSGGCIPEDDQEMRDDLIGPIYYYDASNRILLESKEDMKDRGLHSPDTADALALTFAFPVDNPIPRQETSESRYGNLLGKPRRSAMSR